MSKAVIRAQTVSFRLLNKGTETGYALFNKLEQSLISALLERIFSAFETLKYSLSGCQASRLAHHSKTVTRTDQDSLDIELIIALLIHEIGDDLALEKHSQMAATIIWPYFRSEIN